LQHKISELERELEEAQLKKERALSMAQQTKRGHVYIISNIGSFGENVFKIGMTRRLEPMDRIRELGDASVPFRFDVHALIYSDEARTLEYELHKAFSEKALNLFNFRKEFFNVTLEEIESKIKELGFSAEFTSEPEAMEYKETLAIKNKENIEVTERETLESEFPQSLI
jgi:Meiotically up-regulated gene 113